MKLSELIERLQQIQKELDVYGVEDKDPTVLIRDFETDWGHPIEFVRHSNTTAFANGDYDDPMYFEHVNSGKRYPLGTEFVFIDATLTCDGRDLCEAKEDDGTFYIDPIEFTYLDSDEEEE